MLIKYLLAGLFTACPPTRQQSGQGCLFYSPQSPAPNPGMELEPQRGFLKPSPLEKGPNNKTRNSPSTSQISKAATVLQTAEAASSSCPRGLTERGSLPRPQATSSFLESVGLPLTPAKAPSTLPENFQGLCPPLLTSRSILPAA